MMVQYNQAYILIMSSPNGNFCVIFLNANYNVCI